MNNDGSALPLRRTERYLKSGRAAESLQRFWRGGRAVAPGRVWPRGRGPSREMRRSCHVISLERKTWSRLIRRRIITRKTASMRYYLYVLQSTRADRTYIGSSAEPDERLGSHNAGRVRSTKAWRPWQLVFLEEYQDRATAEKRERYLKSGWGRRELAALLERWQSG